MKMVNYIPEYEAMTGEKVSPVVSRFAEQLDIVCKLFETKGREDAAQGLPVPSDEMFQAYVKKVFFSDSELAEIVADLVRPYYMDGHDAGREAV